MMITAQRNNIVRNAFRMIFDKNIDSQSESMLL